MVSANRDGDVAELKKVLADFGGAHIDALAPLLCNQHWVFRGMLRSDYDLTPSVARHAPLDLLQEEGLIRNFKKYGRADTVAPCDSHLEWLALAQHYRLKTRLLDWTWSLPTALAFSVWDGDGSEPKSESDGVIWCSRFARVNKDNGKLAEYINTRDRFGPLVFHLEWIRRFEQEYSSDSLDRSTSAEALRRHSAHNPFWLDFLSGSGDFATSPAVLFFEPPSADPRFVAQSALFSLVSGCEQDLQKVLGPRSHRAIQEFPTPPSDECLLYKIVVPATSKPVWRKLLLNNYVSWRTLFPDRQGLAAYLNERFKPTNWE